jgi:hypothetical protein
MNIIPLAPAFHIAVFALALSACMPEYPPLAAVSGDAAFKARVATRFPPGSRAGRLRAELAANGFQVFDDPQTRLATAVYTPQNLPCYSVTRIDWREDARGRVREIQASRQACS